MAVLRQSLLACLLVLSVTSAATSVAVGATQQSGSVQNQIGIAAVVNDEAVTFSDIRNRVQLYLVGAPSAPPPDALRKIQEQVLNKLIDERLQMQEAKSLGIKVEDAQVDQGIAQVAAQNKLQPQEFTQKLGASGVKESTLRDKLRAEISWNMVVRRKLRPQVNISESEIDSEIDRLARNKGKAEFNVAEILLTVASPEMEQMVRTDAGKIADQLTGGASFSQVARQFSQSPGAARGGDLGWVQAGQLEPALDKALATLEPGQISQPVKTEKGYHILFLRDKREMGATAHAPAPAPAPAAPVTQAAAVPSAATPAAREDIVHLMQLIIPIAKTDPQPVVAAKVSRAESLKQEVSSCDDMATKAKDFLTHGTGDLGRGPLSSLPPFVRQAVENLPDNELSLPVRTPEGVAVLMVCEREQGAAIVATPTPVATPTKTAAAPVAATQKPEATPVAAPAAALPEDGSREQVANLLGIKRLEQMADRYLKDLRATAYIEKRI